MFLSFPNAVLLVQVPLSLHFLLIGAVCFVSINLASRILPLLRRTLATLLSFRHLPLPYLQRSLTTSRIPLPTAMVSTSVIPPISSKLTETALWSSLQFNPASAPGPGGRLSLPSCAARRRVFRGCLGRACTGLAGARLRAPGRSPRRGPRARAPRRARRRLPGSW